MDHPDTHIYSTVNTEASTSLNRYLVKLEWRILLQFSREATEYLFE